MVKSRRSRRQMAGAGGPLLAELMGRGEEEGEGRRSKEGPPATQSVAPPSPGASAETSKPPSSPARSSGSGSPEPNCAICLGKLENKSFTDSCFHMFCFVCLLEWSKVKPECPLCKQKFKSIVHNVRSYDDYQQYHLERQPETQPANPWENPEGPRFRYRTTMMVGPFQGVLDLIHTYSNRPFTIGSGPNPARRLNNPEATSAGSSWLSNNPFEVPRREAATSTTSRDRDWPLDLTNTQTARQHWRNRRCLATSEFRRRVYSSNLRVVNVRDENNKHRMVTPAFFESNPGATHRLIPWLNRELNALLTVETHSQFVLELIMGLINRYPIQSEEFHHHLHPYLGRNTRHFMDEFYSFARSPFNMAVYDTKAMYREALPEVLDSDSSDDDDVVIVSSSSSDEEEDRRARNPSTQAVNNLLGLPPWDSPAAGPSWDSSPERPERNQTNVSAPAFTTSNATNLPWSLGNSSMSSSGIKSESPAAAYSDSDSDSSSSDVEVDDDVMVVAMEKPWRERSPIVLSSASEDERPPVLQRESQEAPQPPLKLRIKKSRSDRDREFERAHQSRHSSDPHSHSRRRSRSRSRSPVVSSTRSWQIDNQCRSRSSHSNHCDESTSYHSRLARNREHHSRRTRSKSKEARSRDHRHSKSQRSSHSPRSGRKRRHTSSRSNSLEATSSKRKKSKHKKHKKHKKHGKHKQDKKRDEKTTKRSRHRHRSKRSEGGRDDTAAALQQPADAGSSSFSTHEAAAASVRNAGCRELPPEPSTSTESLDVANLTEAGSNLVVAMEIDVGSTAIDESNLINCSESSPDVIAISSDDDDCIEVVGEVEKAPSSSVRNSTPLPFSLEATASRPLQRSSWSTPINIDSDDGRPGLFSQLGDPLLSSAATASDPMLSASVSSPQSMLELAFNADGRIVTRSTQNSNTRTASATATSTVTSSVSASSSQGLRYCHINESAFPSRSSLQVGGQLENGGATLSGSPSGSCALAVELPKWESVCGILPYSTAGSSSSSAVTCCAAALVVPSSTVVSSQSSSCRGLPGSADKTGSAGCSSAAQELSFSTEALPKVNSPRSPSPVLPDSMFNLHWGEEGALEHHSAGCSAPTPEECSAAGTRNSPPSAGAGRALGPVNSGSSLPLTEEGTLPLPGEENCDDDATSEDESSSGSESSDDAMQIVDAPFDVQHFAPLKSPETITSSEDEEGHVSAWQQQMGSGQLSVENDVHKNLSPADHQVDGEDGSDDAVSSDEDSSRESPRPARTELEQPGGNRNDDENILPTDGRVDEEKEEKIDVEISSSEDEDDNERDDASCPDPEDQYVIDASDGVDNRDVRSDAEGCASGNESEDGGHSANCSSEEEEDGEIFEDERHVQAVNDSGAVNEKEEDQPASPESQEEEDDETSSARNDGLGDEEVGDGGEDPEAEEDEDSASEGSDGSLANGSVDSDSSETCTNSDVD